eukprot:gene43034-57237_t
MPEVQAIRRRPLPPLTRAIAPESPGSKELSRPFEPTLDGDSRTAPRAPDFGVSRVCNTMQPAHGSPTATGTIRDSAGGSAFATYTNPRAPASGRITTRWRSRLPGKSKSDSFGRLISSDAIRRLTHFGVISAMASSSGASFCSLMPAKLALAYLSVSIDVMLLAMPLLGERVNWVGWLGAGLGGTGVFLIARPGGNLAPLGVALCLINAVCGTAYNLLTKVLSRSETTNALLFNTAFVGAVVFALLSIGQWHGPMPGLIDFGLMLLLGLLMTSGHFLFTAAYREAPASTVAPIGYMQLFWSGGLGWLVFGH